MTATYVAPGTDDKDTVRFLIGDTVMSNPLLQDEEITFLVGRWLDVYKTLEYVASIAAETIAAKFAREASVSADGVSVNLQALGAQFRELAAQLRQMHKNLLVGGEPDVGGISPYEEPDPDIKPLDMGTGMHDNPEAGRQAYGQYGDYIQGQYVAEWMPGA